MDFFRFSKTFYGIAQIYYTLLDTRGEDAEHIIPCYEVALMSGKVTLKQRQAGSEIPCRWLSRASVYNRKSRSVLGCRSLPREGT